MSSIAAKIAEECETFLGIFKHCDTITYHDEKRRYKAMYCPTFSYAKSEVLFQIRLYILQIYYLRDNRCDVSTIHLSSLTRPEFCENELMTG